MYVFRTCACSRGESGKAGTPDICNCVERVRGPRRELGMGRLAADSSGGRWQQTSNCPSIENGRVLRGGPKDCQRCSEPVPAIIFMHDGPVTGEEEEELLPRLGERGCNYEEAFSSLNSAAPRPSLFLASRGDDWHRLVSESESPLS